MPLPLEKWQERLEGHFKALAATRAESGFPLFALEHGLSVEEIDEISTLLHSRLRANLRLAPHWLVWAVYATERGYTYAGDEYWQSFDEQTPDWEYSDRKKVVPWFRKFQRAYSGVTPSGTWAEHFRIITWPITHAILPQYLQHQFARALYELRFNLAGIKTLEPAAVGRILAANSYYGSKRFEKFLQQEELTGRIVLALLHKDPAEGEEPIYPPTLKRIVTDLERVRSSREWLKEARRVVTDRFMGIGHGSDRAAERSDSGLHSDFAKRTVYPGIRPNLLLRYAGSGAWSALLEISGFRSIATLDADILLFLKRTRCRLNGADDTKPANWLLSGKRKGILKSWPDPQQPLIKFLQPQGTVDHILETDCRMTAGPIWLFRIGRDGTAHEIKGRIVRPGQEYIIVTTGTLPELLIGMTSCFVACSGIKSIRIVVPNNASADYISWLHDLDLQLARTIRVWPAGLPGRGWNGEGSSEYLTTEAPCFGIAHDHPVDTYVLSLNRGPMTVIKAKQDGCPTFVQIQPLPAGTHFLTVKAQRSDSLAQIIHSPPTEGFIELRVREPEPWVPGITSHTGLVITLDPHEPNLDIFWENELNLSVMGPESHHVTSTVSLENGRGEEILAEQVNGPMDLPVTPGAWRKRFSHFVTRENCAWRYLEASAGTLKIEGEELGEYLIRFEREVLPVRWVLRRDHGNITVRLIDDTGHEETEAISLLYGMERPAKAVACASAEFLSGVAVESPGGLLIAQHGEHSDAIVISAGSKAVSLKALGVNPVFSEIHCSSTTLISAFRMLEMWSNARLAGPLASIRRQMITDGFLSAIYRKICGSNWAKAEVTFRANPGLRYSIDTLQSTVDKRPSFAAALRHGYMKMDDDPALGLEWFAGVATRYRICSDHKLSGFALRLAGQPHSLTQAFGTELEALLHKVGNTPVLLRGARLLALLCADRDHDQSKQLLPRWKL